MLNKTILSTDCGNQYRRKEVAMKHNRLLSLVLASVMSIGIFPATPAFAADARSDVELTIQVDDTTKITATIPQEYVSVVSEQDLLDIALDEGLQNGEHINIHHVEVAEDVPQVVPQFIIVVNSYPTTLTKVGSVWGAQSYFVISVAKGQTTTLSKEFSKTLTAAVSGSPYSITAELQASVTASYSVTYEFSEPPESSPFNSREYRVRFYAQTYNYSQDHYMSGLYIGTRTGTVDKPTRWASYSIDSIQ